MKKILVFLVINCFVASSYGMNDIYRKLKLPVDHACLTHIKKALADYVAATNSLDNQTIAHAVAELKQARQNLPWQRFFGYSHLPAHDRLELASVLSDGWIFRHFEQRIDYLPFQERHDREQELSKIRDTIIRNLGYGVYIDARNAYWQFIYAVQECDAAKASKAVTDIEAARAQFSWKQKLGLAYFSEGDCPSYDYKEMISSDTALAQEVMKNLSYCKDVTRAQELVSSQDRYFPIQVLATRESNRKDGFAGNYFQNAVVLEAFYRLRTPLNSAQLLEYAKKQNNEGMKKVIHVNNPDLKN